MAPNPTRHQVTNLGGGRYRVVTVVTVERIVTEEELRAMGIEVPKPEVPWAEPTPEPVPPRREPVPVPPSPVNQVMAHWRATFRGDRPDPRLPRQLPQWLDEHGLARLLRAVDMVAAEKGNPLPRYERFKKALKRLRDEAGTGPPK